MSGKVFTGPLGWEVNVNRCRQVAILAVISLLLVSAATFAQQYGYKTWTDSNGTIHETWTNRHGNEHSTVTDSPVIIDVPVPPPPSTSSGKFTTPVSASW
ncbi:MAG TPA: hypothetical protein QF509_08265 [Rhodospirillales bacterium]|nr:hypothetical protein [Rhodospirillales bacterium]